MEAPRRASLLQGTSRAVGQRGGEMGMERRFLKVSSQVKVAVLLKSLLRAMRRMDGCEVRHQADTGLSRCELWARRGTRGVPRASTRHRCCLPFVPKLPLSFVKGLSCTGPGHACFSDLSVRLLHQGQPLRVSPWGTWRKVFPAACPPEAPRGVLSGDSFLLGFRKKRCYSL